MATGKNPMETITQDHLPASTTGVASSPSVSFVDEHNPALEISVPENVYKLKYDKIKSWYIHRTVVQCAKNRPMLQKSVFHRYVCNLRALHTPMALAYFMLDSYSFNQLSLLDKFYFRIKVERAMDTENPETDNCYSLLHAKEGMFILLDTHRAGKTAYFTWLAWRIQTYDPLLYVIHLNAAEHGSCFEWLKFEDLPNTIDTEVIRTLFRLSHHARTVRNMDSTCTFEIIQEDRDHTDRLAELFTFADGMVLLDESKLKDLALTSNQLSEIGLFREKVNQKQIVFILDGVDQVKPSCRSAVLQFVKRLSHFDGVQKIFLSTNPQCAASVHNLFPNGNVYQLEPLCDCDSILLLHKFLLNQLDAYGQCERKLQLQLVPFLHCAIMDALPPCCLTPLEMRMVFSLYLPVIKRCVDFKDLRVHGSIRHLRKIDSFQLIKRFIDAKLDGSSQLLLTPSASARKQAMTSALKRQLALLAVYTVVDKQYTDPLLTDDERTYAIKLMTDCNADIMQSGFVTMDRDGMLKFGDQILAQYFVACWVYENRARLGSHIMSLCRMFADATIGTFRHMFDRITMEGCTGIVIHIKFCKYLYQISESNFIHLKDEDSFTGKDNIGRTALHWIAISHCETRSFSNWEYDMVLQTIPKQLIDAKDELFRWSAVDFAFYKENWNFMGKCLRLGAKVDIEVWLNQLRSYDLVELFNRIVHLEQYLLNPYTTIPDAGLAQHILGAVSSGIVNHLIYQKGIDIRSPLPELDCLTVLEYCAKRDLFYLFQHFISITASSKKILNEIGQRLFELSVQHDAYRIAVYLMDQCDFQTIPLKSSERWKDEECPEYDFLLCAMELKSMKVFQIFFNLMCKKYKFDCITDGEVVEESCKATITTHQSYRPNVNLITFMPTCFLLSTCEMIICEALYQTKFYIISYIVQKIKMQISHETLTSIIETLSKQTRVLPEASSSILNYLLDSTDNLHRTDSQGKTLLHMAGSIGCVVMMRCLLDRGFDPLTPCTVKNRNVFHYVAARVDDQRAIEIIRQLLPYCSIDRFNVPNKKGHSVCDSAILFRKYRLANMLIHTKASYFSPEKRMSAVLDSFAGLLESNNFEAIVDFLAFSFKHTDNDWKEVYAIIHRQMPIV